MHNICYSLNSKHSIVKELVIEKELRYLLTLVTIDSRALSCRYCLTILLDYMDYTIHIFNRNI